MSGRKGQAEEILKQLLPKIAVINDEEAFKEIYGFYLKDYLQYRSNLAASCRSIASHVEKVVHDTGIAKTAGGGIGVAAGASALAGLFLAPFTAGASLTLTAGGIAGGVAAAATSLTADIVRNKNLSDDEEKLKKVLKQIEAEENIVGELISSIGNDLKKLRELLADPEVLDMVLEVSKGIKKVGYDVIYQGVNVFRTVKAINFARNVAQFIQADFYALSGIAQGMAAPGIGGARIFGRALIAAGSTTAKVFSGIMGAAGIGFGIYDIVSGINDINGSSVAESYRKFADEYETQTKDLIGGIKALKDTATDNN